MDLPTPPLPDATATMRLTPAIGAPRAPARPGALRPSWGAWLSGAWLWLWGSAAGPAAARADSAVRVTTAPVTPGIALMAASALARIGSIAAAFSGSTRMARNTLLSSRIVRPEIASDWVSGVRPSGPLTLASAAST